jgi:CelD/BcsL family acetyltransferase involved in cellulose biosynthesis
MISGHKWEIEWISSEVRFLDLRADWSRVVDQDGRSHPFLEWDWVHTWWQVYKKSNQSLRIGLLKQNNAIVGILPFLHTSQKHGGLNLGVVSFLGAGEVSPPWLDVIGREDIWASAPLEVVSAAIRTAQWHMLDLTPVLPDSIFSRHLLRAFDRRNVEAAMADASPAISLRGGFEEWLSDIGPSTRKDMRRKRACFLSDHNFEIIEHSRSADVAANISKLAQLNRARLTSLGKVGAFHSTSFEEFHSIMMPILADHSACQIYELKWAGRTVAMQAYFGNGSTRYSYLSGLDPAALELGPGSILDAELFFRIMNQTEVRTIDLGVGDQEYKFRYGAVERRSLRYSIYRSSALRQLAAVRRTLMHGVMISNPGKGTMR